MAPPSMPPVSRARTSQASASGGADVSLADLVIALLVVAAVAGGLRLGLVARLASWIVMVVGLVLAIRLLPTALGWLGPPSGPVVLVVVVVVVGAGLLIGESVGTAIGVRLRPRRGTAVLGPADRIAGGAVAGIGVLVVVWLLVPVAAGTPGVVSSQVTNSSVARWLASTMPTPPDVSQALRSLAGGAPFPDVFEVLRPAPDLGPPPASTELTQAVTDAAARAVVRVRTEACGLTQTGTGFVVDSGEGRNVIVTNAHVVAGADAVYVDQDGGGSDGVTVVGFDPVSDIAVLRTPAAIGPALTMAQAPAGRSGGVFGHPGGEPLRIAPAQIAETVRATGRDIYGNPGAVRTVVQLAAALRPGDSGAPLVVADGTVAAMVFAIASDRSDVAYALDPAEIDRVLATSGVGAVDPGPCVGR